MSFRGDGTRPGARDGVSPPLAPSQGCEQETTTAETTGQRHEARRRSNELLVLCRDPCSNGPEDCLIENGRADPQAGSPFIVVRVRASVPPHL